MADKTCVVTGGNKGIGYEIVKALAALQMHVILVSRSRERGLEAITALQAEQPDAQITLLVGDLSSVAGTRQLASKIRAECKTLDLLINNAGIWPTSKEINEDGLEVGFMVNFLAPFMLSHLLAEQLISSAPARIVHVNAGLYVKGRVDIDKTPYGADFGRIRTYASTKLCSVLTLEREAANFAPHDVTVNMVHPGVVNTDLGQFGGVMGWLLKWMKRNWMTPQQGAVAPVWLATAPELAGKTGRYFNEKVFMPIDDVAKNGPLAAELWDFAMQIAEL